MSKLESGKGIFSNEPTLKLKVENFDLAISIAFSFKSTPVTLTFEGNYSKLLPVLQPPSKMVFAFNANEI